MSTSTPDTPAVTRRVEAADRPRAHDASFGRVLADAFAVLLVADVVWLLAFSDGGFGPGGYFVPGVLGLLTVPAAAADLRRLPRSIRWLVLAWGLGLTVAFAFAANREGSAEAMLAYGLPPLVALATWRILQRSWGRRLLAVLLMAGLASYWIRGLVWWVQGVRDPRNPGWLVVSWHNPSAMLLGTFAAYVLAVVLHARHRRVTVFAGAGASLGLGALWLTGSRGGLIATLVTLTVVAAASLRRVGGRRIVVTAAAVTAGAAVVAFAILALPVGDPPTGDPLRGREASASGNLRARLTHMEAAAGMFADRPLTGQGPGSYLVMSRPWTPDHAVYTSSAHNEFLEVAGETGLVFGVPFAAGCVLAAALAWRSVRRDIARRPHGDGQDWLVHALEVAAAGTVAGLLLHTAVDVDWRYAVLPSLLAVAVAILGSRVPVPATDRSRWLGVAAAPLVAVVAAGTILTGVEAYTPSRADAAPAAWKLTSVAEAMLDGIERGKAERAAEAARPARTWNPGTRDAATLVALGDLAAGTGQVQAVVNSLDEHGSTSRAFVWSVEVLEALGYDDLARDMVQATFDLDDRGRVFEREETLTRLWEARIRLDVASGVCTQAVDANRTALRQLSEFDTAELRQRLHAALGPCSAADR